MSARHAVGGVEARVIELARLAGSAAATGAEAARQSDRWFLLLVALLREGVERSSKVAERVGQRAYPHRLVERLRERRRAGARERIRSTLRAEARRHGLDLGTGQMELFTESMATLLAMVMRGELDPADIALEAAEEASGAAAPQPGAHDATETVHPAQTTPGPLASASPTSTGGTTASAAELESGAGASQSASSESA